MKICILGNAQSIHVQRWAEYFIRKGEQVFLLSPLPADREGDIHFYYLKPSRLKMSYLSVLIEEISYPLQARRIIRQIRPDILHAFYAELYGWLAALSGFHPFVISVFGGDVAIDPQKGRFIKSKVAFGLNHADVITAQTRAMMQFLNKEFKMHFRKMEYMPWGVDLNIFHRGYAAEVHRLRRHLNIPDQAPVILSPRQMHPLYQIESIVQAIPAVLEKHPKSIFVFLSSLDPADNGQYRAKMTHLAQKLNVSANTRFITAPVSQNDMAVYLNIADVSISTPKIDQFGLTVLEAMACGSIPIVNNLECYKEYLTDGQNAFFVTDSQPGQIAQRVNDCLDTPAIRERFDRINQQIIHTSENWHHNATKMERLYERLTI